MSAFRDIRCVVVTAAVLVAGLGACGSGPCTFSMTVDYAADDPSAPCTLTLTGPSGAIVVDFGPELLANCGPVDGGARDCTALMGPMPAGCARCPTGSSADDLYVDYFTSIAPYTGSSTVVVSLSCGGTSAGPSFTQTEQCYHGD